MDDGFESRILELVLMPRQVVKVPVPSGVKEVVLGNGFFLSDDTLCITRSPELAEDFSLEALGDSCFLAKSEGKSYLTIERDGLLFVTPKEVEFAVGKELRLL